MTQKDLHIGIYGVLTKGDSILVINKSRGPYKGLLDLPGGRPTHGERLQSALKREFKEETGVEVQSFSFIGNFSFLTPFKDPKNFKHEFYHIALIYKIEEASLSSYNAHINEEDVDGSIWINWAEIVEEKCSPLLKAVLPK